MIELANPSRIYHTCQGRRTVLDGINLRVAEEEETGVLGRNSTEKSTMIRMISGAELPSAGKICHGMSVSWPLVFGGALQGSLTGIDNLCFICRVYGSDTKAAEPFVQEFSGLEYYLREPVKTYSASMRARLASAISMAIEFDCFLIDEIIAVDDSRFHSKYHRELFEKRRDRPLIIISHGAGYIREHCGSAAVLVQGKLHTFEQVNDAYAFYQGSVG